MGGHAQSEESRKKTSESLKGHPVSDETREKIRASHLGKKLTKEHCDNMSKSLKEKYIAEPHHMVGKHLTDEWKEGIRKSMMGKNSGMNGGGWKGDDVKYGGLHARMRKLIPCPEVCSICKQPLKLEIHNISGTYPKNDLSDWIWVCHDCHIDIDGRRERSSRRMKEYNKTRRSLVTIPLT